ncbi:MAG TPA: ATP-binding cassette domain-containing protein [Candidatus Latescibacteria bacterium]|jgi:cell division transport system ATP-binding protein|nr:ATP-binding cassette domain-containing protein [Candidatus Latescibacterota bacterium]HOF61184.1 ATP-binding cassette domain-containing protein [Candidatus Latescibacterota bacterium]HOM57022.1 ATP-binding cassette domain-containing protein [Candidatus Latescibacterota bacterium]HOS65063.1 ATP-binding cassette domain-containing protein [Candidatus Latescibacterota bacterium]HOT37318.1 ATP-binding cassette domain-containing protein [Candidatus Latescibacterota bacterium]
MGDTPFLAFDAVTLQGRRAPIVEDVSLSLAAGGFGVLFGPTGGGKTTILRLAHLELRPTVGRVKVGDISSDHLNAGEAAMARRAIGMVYQDSRLLPDRSASENIILPLQIAGMATGMARRRALEVLGQVGLAGKRSISPRYLSGGELQRLALARALAMDPHLLLADEPTGNLDSDTAEEIMTLIRRINARGTTVLLATHDLKLIGGYGYPCWRVEDGHAVQEEPR